MMIYSIVNTLTNIENIKRCLLYTSILMMETLLVGVIALVVGLLLGILFSQGMSLITAKMFEVQLKEYVFVFYRRRRSNPLFILG